MPLQAIMMLARHNEEGAITVRDIAQEEKLRQSFLS
jgi:DNA-binding IscR family transcriptional regulator